MLFIPISEDSIPIDIEHMPLVTNQLRLSTTTNKSKFVSQADKENKQLWAQKEKIFADYGLGIQGYHLVSFPVFCFHMLT